MDPTTSWEPTMDKDCIDPNTYKRAAAFEYYNDCTNYRDASEYCSNRSFLLAAELADQCPEAHLAGKDRTWATQAEMGPPGLTVPDTVDDLIFKIVIRYPKNPKNRKITLRYLIFISCFVLPYVLIKRVRQLFFYFLFNFWTEFRLSNQTSDYCHFIKIGIFFY